VKRHAQTLFGDKRIIVSNTLTTHCTLTLTL